MSRPPFRGSLWWKWSHGENHRDPPVSGHCDPPVPGLTSQSKWSDVMEVTSKTDGLPQTPHPLTLARCPQGANKHVSSHVILVKHHGGPCVPVTQTKKLRLRGTGELKVTEWLSCSTMLGRTGHAGP